jgi:hypothetical protein
MTLLSLPWLQPGTGRIRNRHLFVLLVFLVLPTAVHATDCLVSPALPCTFTLTEPFNGSNWPTQPIDFRYDGGFAMVKTAKVVNGGGSQIPFQWVSSCWDSTAILGCIEIQDSLPAGATQTYTLEAGPSSATVSNPVVATNNVSCYSGGATCIQVTNGLTGVQVPTVASNGAAASYRLAPIQGIGLPNGSWTGAIGAAQGGSPNLIYGEASSGIAPYPFALHTPIKTATGYTTKFLDYGPLKTVLQLSYAFNRPDYVTTAVKYQYVPICGAANSTYPNGYITVGGVIPANATLIFNASGFCSVGTGSAPLDTAHYYTPTLIVGSPYYYTLTTVVGGVVTPVKITGTVTGTPGAAFVVDSATGCTNGCQNSQPGRLVVTLTLYANSQSVVITEDSDMQHAEYYPFYNEITPDTARFRNNPGTGTSDPRCGYVTPNSVTAVGTAAGTATISVGTAASNGQEVIVTGVGSGSNLPNGVYYLQTTSPYSATTPGIWTTYSGGTFSGATTAPGSYGGGGLVKAAPTFSPGFPQYSPVSDLGFDFPWTYGDTGFVEADPYPGTWTGCQTTSGHVTSTTPLVINYPPSDYNDASTWENYRAEGSGSSPVLGWYTGDAGLMNNAASGKMPGLYIAASGFISGWGRTAAIQDMNLINSLYPWEDNWGSQKSWAIWASTNSDIPAFSSSTHPAIQDDLNKFTGVNLSHVYAYHAASTSTPGGGWTWLYMANSNATNAGQEMNCLIARVQDGSSTCAGMFPDGRTATPCSSTSGSSCYHDLLYYNSTTDNTSRALLNMWQTERTSPSTAVGTAIGASGCPSLTSTIGTSLAAGDNHFDNRYNYYQIALYFEPCYGMWDGVLTNPNATASQQSQMATEAGIFGGMMWDNSWFAWDNIAGDGLGLANQQVQYAQDRASMVYQYGTNGANSLLASKVPIAVSSTTQQLKQSIGCAGAVIGGTHYQVTYNQALIPNSQITDLQGSTSFANECQFNTGLPEWFLAITTPPDPRYGNLRKKVATGDTTAEEADVYVGRLATDLYVTNTTTAGWMSWLWHQYGNSTFQYQDNFSLTQIDETIPQITPTLASQQIDGYASVHRAGTLGGGQETALWFINGGNAATQPIYYSLQGHRHYDDGNVSIFALGAPLSMDWGANLYYPETADRFSHNAITFDGEMNGTSWAQSSPPFDTYGQELLGSPTVTAFQAFASSTESAANFTYPGDGTVWTRAVRTMAPDPNYPIFYIKDTFAGGSGGGKTLTWNMEATGSVNTPSGAKTPTVSFSDGCNAYGALPSANDTSGLAPYNMANGLQQFSFTGFTWPKYASTNLKWNLYQRPTSGNAQWLIGNWGHGCGAGVEVTEFETANASASWYGSSSNACNAGNSSGFCDWQHILRVHDIGPFETVMTPTVASGTPASVSYSNGVYTAAFGSTESLTWNDSYSTFTNGVIQILTMYNSSTQSAFGVAASGGPQEIANNGAGTITWTIDDVNPATRTLRLPPGTWYPSVPVQQTAGAYTYYHGGGAEPSPAVVTFTQTPVTLRSVPLNYSAPPGVAQIRVKFGSSTNYAAITSCNPLCSIVMQAPVGTWPEQHDFLDGNGNVITSSQVRNVVVQ